LSNELIALPKGSNSFTTVRKTPTDWGSLGTGNSEGIVPLFQRAMSKTQLRYAEGSYYPPTGVFESGGANSKILHGGLLAHLSTLEIDDPGEAHQPIPQGRG
jgi:hypothetical protein